MKKLRYAVVGLGHIAQVAVLPAFRGSKHAELTAFVSGDRKKLRELGKKYEVKNLFTYEQYDECLRSGLIDAVYIALPNDMHKDYTVRAAEAGIHVLCEKPMAITAGDCIEMIRACDTNRVKLMIAYRLHFEEANLTAIDLCQKKRRLGDVKMIQSIHSQAAKLDNIRNQPASKGGGPTYDMGIYDVNAARYLFQDEPVSVSAQAAYNPKFDGAEETMSVTLRFPGDRLASIIYSFGTVDTDTFRVVGTQGELSLDPAYTYHGAKKLKLTLAGKPKETKFKARDQFAPELDYFAESVRKNRRPEPSGEEGLADIRIIEAIYESARTGKVIDLEPIAREQRPGLSQEIRRPAVKEPEVIDADSPSKETA